MLGAGVTETGSPTARSEPCSQERTFWGWQPHEARGQVFPGHSHLQEPRGQGPSHLQEGTQVCLGTVTFRSSAEPGQLPLRCFLAVGSTFLAQEAGPRVRFTLGSPPGPPTVPHPQQEPSPLRWQNSAPRLPGHQCSKALPPPGRGGKPPALCWRVRGWTSHTTW